jgi:hypothetical protein
MPFYECKVHSISYAGLIGKIIFVENEFPLRKRAKPCLFGDRVVRGDIVIGRFRDGRINRFRMKNSHAAIIQYSHGVIHERELREK